MPSWDEVTSDLGKIHSIRRELLAELSAHTGRNTIIYHSAWLDRPELADDPSASLEIHDADVHGFMTVIHGLDRTKGLDLMLHVPGDDMAAAGNLIDYVRRMFGDDVRAIIPQLTVSGSTIIALSCRAIVIGRHSCIRPIDPHLGEDSYAKLIGMCEDADAEGVAEAGLSSLISRFQQADPKAASRYARTIGWARKAAARRLESNMFKGSGDGGAAVKKILSRLSCRPNDYNVGIDQAKELFGDRLVELESDDRLQDLVLSVHHAAVASFDGGYSACYKIIENQEGAGRYRSHAVPPSHARHAGAT